MLDLLAHRTASLYPQSALQQFNAGADHKATQDDLLKQRDANAAAIEEEEEAEEDASVDEEARPNGPA